MWGTAGIRIIGLDNSYRPIFWPVWETRKSLILILADWYYRYHSIIFANTHKELVSIELDYFNNNMTIKWAYLLTFGRHNRLSKNVASLSLYLYLYILFWLTKILYGLSLENLIIILPRNEPTYLLFAGTICYNSTSYIVDSVNWYTQTVY